MKHSDIHDSKTVVHCIVFPAANPFVTFYGDISKLFVKCSNKVDSLHSFKRKFFHL